MAISPSERAKVKGSSGASFQQKPSVFSQLRFIIPREYPSPEVKETDDDHHR